MAKTIRIDFTGVDKEIRRGGKAAHLPEGDYLFKVVKHEIRKTKDGSGRYIAWQVQCVTPKYKGKMIYHNTSLKPEALWNLRNLIHACTGKNVGGKIADFNPISLYGKIFAGTTEDDEYENPETGKVTIKSQLADLRPKEELEGGDDEDDEDDDEDADDDEEEDEGEDEDDEEDEEEDEPEPVKKKAKKKKKKDDDLEDVDVESI